MSFITDMITDTMMSKVTDVVQKKLGLDENISKDSLTDVAGAFIGMMKNNVSDADTKAQVVSALASHTDSSLEDEGILDSTEGNKILGHVFGDKLDGVVGEFAKKYNVDASAAKDVFAQVSPMMMGLLGKGAKDSSFDISNLLKMAESSLGGNGASILKSAGVSMLDQDGDGDIDMSDVMNFAKGFLKK